MSEIEYCAAHPEAGCLEATRSKSQKACISRFLMLGIAGNHGYEIVQLGPLRPAGTADLYGVPRAEE